jgi:predicted nucleic acid-binding protein
MIELLIDTNIIIYLLNGNKHHIEFVRKLGGRKLGTSVISFIEVLVGTKNPREQKEVSKLLENFEVIPLNKEISTRTANFLRGKKKKSTSNPKLADIIIASTALELKVPLVTNNPKDFKTFKKLKLITP